MPVNAMLKAFLLGYLLAQCRAFAEPKRTITTCASRPLGRVGVGATIPAMASDPNNDDDENNNLDAFLDKQLFDPNAPSNDDNWFANLVRNDYDSAEALYVGAIGLFGVILSQELLRIVKYGSAYTPFGSPGSGHYLF